MGELREKDIYAAALAMPDPATPVCKEWVEEIKRHVEKNKEDELSLVGHSLGVPAILRFLEEVELEKKIKKVVLVSGPCKPIEDKVHEAINHFLAAPFNYDEIKKRAEDFFVIHGDNDQVVPPEEASILTEKLGAKLSIIPNGGHLNGSSGWVKLPEVLQALTST